MLKLCPCCKHLSIEYDPYHRIEKCLNINCGWVGRGSDLFKDLENFEYPKMRISETLEKQNGKTISKV